MIIAQEKRKTNIAEYILYMWQIEDLIRALGFNIDQIEAQLVNQYEVDDSKKKEIFDWYQGIADSMKTEGIQQHGHLHYLQSLVEELNDFHFRLVESPHQSNYQKKYQSRINDISELRKKMATKERITDMEVCLTALYGLLLMRIKKKPITEDTERVLNSFSELLADLSELFRKFETGLIEI